MPCISLRLTTDDDDDGTQANSLQDVDQWSLEVSKYDGLGREPQYVAPQCTGPLPVAESENEKLCTGGSHCEAVTIASQLKHLSPKEKNSFRSGGTIICYARQDQVAISGTPNLTTDASGQPYPNFDFAQRAARRSGLTKTYLLLSISISSSVEEMDVGTAGKVARHLARQLRCFVLHIKFSALSHQRIASLQVGP
ncbi:hypothetical protein DSL72_003700 [Monilinia vaccinii-corymbosi]|uniref:Uncharacterized protein n=1 Tax=Monilinia vaccinii-corymbosi TaxID=61207 RepID=A0A8A3P871_9HELO|nr:hypothetical protein DSL72_003700 [Monilinia vaccinii-corymbosi]